MAFALLSNKSALLGQALAAKPAVGRAQVQFQQRSLSMGIGTCSSMVIRSWLL
jgi:hypothetical protein